MSRCRRDSMPPPGNRFRSIRHQSGSAMRSLASGRIGGLSVWKAQATGWRARCIWRVRRPTNITRLTTGILRKWASRISCHCSRQRTGILRNSWRSISAVGLSISSCWATTMTTMTCGTRNTSHGTRRISAPRKISSMVGPRRLRRLACPWASPSMPIMPGPGMSPVSAMTSVARRQACTTTAS